MSGIIDSGDKHYRHRIAIGTPTMGLIRVEWARARYASQARPVNWIETEIMPLGFVVDAAQNVIVNEVIKGGFEWLLLIEDDVILPPDALRKFGRYMESRQYPIVSGLYFTKSADSDPLIFRGRGNGVVHDFEIGEPVWCDGVPTGCLLIHASILQALWDKADEYRVGKADPPIMVRKVFRTVREAEMTHGGVQFSALQATSDIMFCDDVMAGGYLDGWDLPHPEWPFLVDTSIFCQHIGKDGSMFPRVIER